MTTTLGSLVSFFAAPPLVAAVDAPLAPRTDAVLPLVAEVLDVEARLTADGVVQTAVGKTLVATTGVLAFAGVTDDGVLTGVRVDVADFLASVVGTAGTSPPAAKAAAAAAAARDLGVPVVGTAALRGVPPTVVAVETALAFELLLGRRVVVDEERDGLPPAKLLIPRLDRELEGDILVLDGRGGLAR